MGTAMKGDRLSARLVVPIIAVLMVLSGCAETQFVVHSAKRVVSAVEDDDAASKQPAGRYKIGNPYQIQGVWYYPAEDYEYDETGISSWYGAQFHGRKTANGETYDMNALTAAHRTLPMPSYVRITNLENGRSLILRVNDRGPFARGRILDVSRRGSQLLGFHKNGTARVRVQIMADRSRALAVRVKGQAELAKIGSPITVDRLPKPEVKSETLAPLPGTQISPEVSVPTSPVPQQPAEAPAPVVTAEPTDGEISIVPVKSTNIFVQAGAFGLFDNANKVRARLTPYGPVKLTSVLVNGKDLYRVRMGPMASVSEADRMLDSVTRAGFSDARIIVE